MASPPTVNDLWRFIAENQVNGDMLPDDLAGFKRSSLNYRLTSFDVQTNGVRYLKTLVYNLAADLSVPNRERLRRVHHRDVGDPYAITSAGDRVCLDYLRAVLDAEFIHDGLTATGGDLDGGRILEIGAGYGRTAHTLLSLHDLAGYTIVDLPTTLQVSRAYLGAVLDERTLARVSFVPFDQLDARDVAAHQLAVNIDSLAEMDLDTVAHYLRMIDGSCRYFYTNNPVGKYDDPSLDGHGRGAAAVERALRPGLLTDVVDIDDDRAVAAQAPRFVEAYRPGPAWAAVADAWARPYTWYWQAIYRRTGTAATAPANGPTR